MQRALGLLRLWRCFDRHKRGRKRVRTVKGHCHKKVTLPLQILHGFLCRLPDDERTSHGPSPVRADHTREQNSPPKRRLLPAATAFTYPLVCVTHAAHTYTCVALSYPNEEKADENLVASAKKPHRWEKDRTLCVAQ